MKTDPDFYNSLRDAMMDQAKAFNVDPAQLCATSLGVIGELTQVHLGISVPEAYGVLREAIE